ncbi:MAG: lipoprotein [Spiroplasma sp.]|nr:lipoprotein [Spiroplasma sp.]
MKKLLSMLGAISLTALASTTVVACGQQEQAKTPETLNGKSFSVNLDDLKIDATEKDKSKQEQWGEGSAGFLYSTLWSINQANEEYPIQNSEVASYLTKGESLLRGADDGTNITINGKTLAEIASENGGADWHTTKLEKEDKVVLTVSIRSYEKGGAPGKLTENVKITLNII